MRDELFKSLLRPSTTFGAVRSSKWSSVRNTHLKSHPKCEVCGSTKDVQVHHIKPFHLHPELELEPSNLVSLCECKSYGINCHLLLVGHCGNFKKENPQVLTDIYYVRRMLNKSGGG